MAKEVMGWRGKEWDPDSEMGRIILEMVTGEDGWICPHCYCKETLEEADDITHETYHQLMDEDKYIDYRCGTCGKYYYLKCHVRRNYYSCLDNKFEE